MSSMNIVVGGVTTSIFFIFLSVVLNFEECYEELNYSKDTLKIVTPTPSTNPSILFRDRAKNEITQERLIGYLPDKFTIINEKNISTNVKRREDVRVDN